MNVYERAEYGRLRAKGNGAKYAYLLATKDRGGPDVPTEDGGTWDADGWHLRLRIRPDDDPGLRGGRYTDTYEPGALDREEEGYTVGRHEFRYFIPDITEKMHIRDGVEPADAARYAREELARAEAYGEGEWSYVFLTVEASRLGVKLGSASLSGIESDCGLRHIRETVADLAREAIAEARETLEDLKESD